MDSRLDPVFPTPPRQTQPTDTRQEIKREEPHDDRPRKQKDPRKTPDEFDRDDVPRVSVSSLIVFLENMVSAQSPASTPHTEQRGAVAESALSASCETPSAKPLPGRAAAAAQAYRHAGEPSSSPWTHQTPSVAPSDANPVLGAEDLRTIHALLPVLRDLAEGGVGNLVLEKADRFLDCLVNAAEKARAAGNNFT